VPFTSLVSCAPSARERTLSPPSREHPPHSVVICQTPTARQPVPKRGICSRAGHWSECHLTHMAPWQGPWPSSSRCFSSAAREQSPHPPFAPPCFSLSSVLMVMVLDAGRGYSSCVRAGRQQHVEGIIGQGRQVPCFCPAEIGEGPHLFEISE